MAVIPTPKSLVQTEQLSTASFCRRRLAVVLVRLKMAESVREAATFVEQGHVRVGPNTVTDPAFHVTRHMEDFVTWVDTSKIKRKVRRGSFLGGGAVACCLPVLVLGPAHGAVEACGGVCVCAQRHVLHVSHLRTCPGCCVCPPPPHTLHTPLPPIRWPSTTTAWTTTTCSMPEQGVRAGGRADRHQSSYRE